MNYKPLPTKGLAGWYWHSPHAMTVYGVVTLALSQGGVWIAWAFSSHAAFPWFAAFIVGFWPFIICNLLLSIYNVSKI